MKLLQLFEVTKHDKEVIWDNGQFFIAVNNPAKPTFFTAWTQDNEKVGTLSTKVMTKGGEPWLAVDYVDVDKKYQRQGIARALYLVMIEGMSPEYAGLFGYGPDIVSKHIAKIYRRYGAYEQEDGHYYVPNPNRMNEATGYGWEYLTPSARVVKYLGTMNDIVLGESVGKKMMEEFAQSDVDNLFWFWANPQSGEIYHIDGTHTTAALDPRGPIGLNPEYYGGYDNVDIDDNRVFHDAFKKGWVRCGYINDHHSAHGTDLGLHGANRNIVMDTLKMLLEKGLEVASVGLRGEFDGFGYDGAPEEMGAL
jgi:GNAT superfamily N-acetyltransferase